MNFQAWPQVTVRRRALGVLAVAAFSRALVLLTSVFLARQLGSSGFGVYATAIATLTLLGVPTMLGLPTLVVRLVAAYEVQSDWGRMRGLLRGSGIVVFLLSLLVGVAAAIVILAESQRLGQSVTVALWWALGLLPLMTLTAILSAALRGLHHVVVAQLPQSTIMPLLFLGFLVGWRWFSVQTVDLTPAMALFGRMGAQIVGLVVASVLLHRLIPRQVAKAPPKYEARGWLHSAAPLLILGGLGVVNTRTDVLMLGLLRGPEAAGIYQASARGAELVAFALIVVNLVTQPTLARLYAQADLVGLQRIVTASARAAFCGALPVAVVLIALGRPLLSRVFGADFGGGTVALGILAVSQIVNAGMGSVAQILNMTGHENQAARGMAVGALANVCLNLVLIQLWGVNGAALATATSLVLWNGVLGAYVRRLGIYPSVFGPMRGGRPG